MPMKTHVTTELLVSLHVCFKFQFSQSSPLCVSLPLFWPIKTLPAGKRGRWEREYRLLCACVFVRLCVVYVRLSKCNRISNLRVFKLCVYMCTFTQTHTEEEAVWLACQ